MLDIGHMIMLLISIPIRNGIANELNCKLLVLCGRAAKFEIIRYISIFAESVDERLSLDVFLLRF